MGEYSKNDNNVKCYICGKDFHVKPKRVKRLVGGLGITCSKKCSNKLKKIMYMGRKNPNTKYFKLDDNFFKEIKTADKAYLLGWIASDGTITSSSISIAIDKKDNECLEKIRNIICEELPIVPLRSLVSLTISSKTISTDVCKLLKILPRKKSDKVCFPDLETDELKWAFLRGFFDGDGSVRNITDTHNTPSCNITTSSEMMRKAIISFTKIPCIENGDKLYWSGNNSLDFLDKIYLNSNNLKLDRKYEQYLILSTWVPSVSYSRYYKNIHCTWAKTRKDAISPSKERASDSGYDLVLKKK